MFFPRQELESEYYSLLGRVLRDMPTFDLYTTDGLTLDGIVLVGIARARVKHVTGRS